MIELSLTLILVGIILGITVVGWNWFLSSSKNDEAAALLDRVVTLEQPFARDWGSYTGWPADLPDLGTDVTLVNGMPSQGPRQVSVVVGSQGSLALAVKLSGGGCLFRVVSSLAAGGGSTVPTGIPATAPCTGQSALPAAEDPLAQSGSLKTSGY